MSGDWVGGEGLEERPLVPFPFENLAACFVTAATTPPPSFPFFLSFLEPGMNGNQVPEEQHPARASTGRTPRDSVIRGAATTQYCADSRKGRRVWSVSGVCWGDDGLARRW